MARRTVRGILLRGICIRLFIIEGLILVWSLIYYRIIEDASTADLFLYAGRIGLLVALLGHVAIDEVATRHGRECGVAGKIATRCGTLSRCFHSEAAATSAAARRRPEVHVTHDVGRDDSRV